MFYFLSRTYRNHNKEMKMISSVSIVTTKQTITLASDEG